MGNLRSCNIYYALQHSIRRSFRLSAFISKVCRGSRSSASAFVEFDPASVRDPLLHPWLQPPSAKGCRSLVYVDHQGSLFLTIRLRPLHLEDAIVALVFVFLLLQHVQVTSDSCIGCGSEKPLLQNLNPPGLDVKLPSTNDEANHRIGCSSPCIIWPPTFFFFAVFILPTRPAGVPHFQPAPTAIQRTPHIATGMKRNQRSIRYSNLRDQPGPVGKPILCDTQEASFGRIEDCYMPTVCCASKCNTDSHSTVWRFRYHH